MQYRLEWRVKSEDPDIIFHNLYFNTFKINIIERYGKNSKGYPKLLEVLFKVRTLDDELMMKKDGSGRVRVRHELFARYKEIVKELQFKNKYQRQNRKVLEQEYIDFLLLIVIKNYNI
ncbi:prevent-host-death protein [Chryseobacterium sp.]|uniref:prevent-host-death protein n=1 Tax=Chryseobacterium sp. TaxID=1871047 RepID=UPI00289E0997|nr:prevent-host-death protein [Chryseobacterium sp.]